MSRIGKLPVQIPAGVTATVNGTHVHVKGPKGELDRNFSELVTIKLDGDVITVTPVDETREANAQHGLTRSLISNMVVGVSDGFSKNLELVGVGYRAALKGTNLEMSLGFSHPVIVEAPEGISYKVPDNTHIVVEGISKERVGQVAAEIRDKRPPEPYKGKGVRYEGEHVRRKLGKAAK
ncbi:MAG: 50S ribosomal protein L6 [Atopobiaceae bacterium]|jgi:large subunit ribosomal protein L6|nr:50S ribosomal protein L6 [Atopobiaceae bacterium]